MAKRRTRRRIQPASAPAIVLLALLVALALAGLYGVIAGRLQPPTRVSLPLYSLEERPRLEIRNGCGEAGLAARVKSRLLDLGVDVVQTGNADDFDYPRSILIDLKGDVPGTRQLGADLGLETIIRQQEAGTIADYALVLGHDYQEIQWLK